MGIFANQSLNVIYTENMCSWWCGYIVSSVADVSNTTGYELEVFCGHLVRAMTCPTLIIPVLYSMGITTAALGKERQQFTIFMLL